MPEPTRRPSKFPGFPGRKLSAWLLGHWGALRQEMEERTRERTAGLTQEMAERDELEKAVLEVSEHERYAAGHELHDGLCRHLHAITELAHALGDKVPAGPATEPPEVAQIVSLVDQSIEQMRRLARDLLLAEITPDDLIAVLKELAEATRARSHIDCRFHCQGKVRLGDSGIAAQLIRIAQEATESSVEHGDARHIVISLIAGPQELTLQVYDDAVGLRPSPLPGPALGRRIMAHRAAVVGARLSIEAAPGGGTRVICRLPNRE